MAAGLGPTDSSGPQTERNVVDRAQVREQSVVLEDHADVTSLGLLEHISARVVNDSSLDDDPTTVDGLETGDRPQHRGLSRSVGADDSDDLACVPLQRHIDGEGREADDHVGIDERGHARTTKRWRSDTRIVSETATSKRLKTVAAGGFVSNA